jgi:hypothetical protein
MPALFPFQKTHIQEYDPANWNVVSSLQVLRDPHAIVLILKIGRNLDRFALSDTGSANELNGSGF